MKSTNVFIKFPSQFSQYVNNVSEVAFEGETIIDFINFLEARHGNIKERLLDSDGQLRPYLNFFIGKKNIHSLNGINSVIPNGERLSLLLSRAGG